ncbi:glycerol-3-phosphate dehydrogenase [Bacillus mesophilus]|uniref:NAD(P)/FAD-dependent oxidoreductase n=1 Tax=Bacillus mesophilus TaxID=1808955 RepID=A0A6M0QAY7_9BACI|nr:NAD(P)/FAD-dependent oxidoreductase [Bacillus mesophilus]MBM7662873.1 glycerol-3-phosphate dehydrogenase [Bacillus mesophilus]NEY73463.1 NAD(P)/FAD-dependent oxidoreductase [Bacillus mesophilus]
MTTNAKDVVVIGGGIVGTSILRLLSFYDINVCLIEKQPDVCEGSSKANSGIIHTGFDARPDSIEALCLRESRDLWPQLVEDLKIPFVECGAVMVATTEEEKEIIFTKYIPNAKANDVKVSWLSKEEVLAYNPAVSPSTVGGLLIPGEAIADPFWATRAFAEVAVLNGAEVKLNAGVTDITEQNDSFRITLETGEELETNFVINAAGLWSDEIARMIGDDSFSITPRKGQFILTEEQIDISQIILPVPTQKSKGTLVSPVVFGGFLLGPTAEDQEDKWDRGTTPEGLDLVLKGCEKLVPGAANCESIRQFAGVRAVCSEGDFVIRSSEVNKRLIHAAGIRSTGVSSSPGIAQFVVERLSEAGLSLQYKESYTTSLPDQFNDAQDTGEIVCLCRSISKREITNAIQNPLSVLTLDGVKRRTGATLGECQGNLCISKIVDLLQDTEQQTSITKGLQQSYLACKGGINHEL